MIDGQSARRCVEGANDAALDGFVVANGYADATSGVGAGLYNNGTAPTVANCTFTNCSASRGGGIFNETGSTPTLTNCIFDANSSTGCGGAMFNHGAAAAMTSCTFTANSSGYGGAMYNAQCSPTITACTFSNNSAAQMAGGIYNNSASPHIVNCVFVSNSSAGTVGGLYNGDSSSPIIFNCTFTRNWAGTWASCGIYNDITCAPIIANCILWGDTDSEILNHAGANPDVAYCDVQGGYTGTRNIDLDPLFVNAAAGNLRPTSGSPCIAGGTNTGAPATDIIGIPRPRSGGVTIGAYEYEIMRWYVNVNNRSSTHDGTSWATAYTSIQQAVTVASPGSEIWVAQGVYSSLTSPVVTMKSGVNLYGAFAGTESDRNQRNWITLITTIDGQSARRCVMGADNAALEGFVVANGHVDTTNGLGGGMYTNSASPTVANCTFVNGTAYRGAGMYNEVGSMPTITNCIFNANSSTACGGGMFNSDAVAVINCTFTANSSGYGGAMYNIGCAPTITACIFSDNSATQMTGGVYNNVASPEIVNCVFIGNSSAGTVGGLYKSNSSSPRIFNCTFTRNSADTWASCGIYNNTGCAPIITNCILWGDKSGEILNNTGVNPTVTYCDVQGGYAGVGNIDLDPLFVNAGAGDVRLTNPSPCIDTGTSVGVPSLDITGYARPVDIPGLGLDGTGTEFDMGAYEAHFPLVVSIVCAGAPLPNAPSVDFTVTFSKPVTNVTAADFFPVVAGLSGAVVTDVTPVGGTVCTVSVETSCGDGTLGLNVIDHDSILDSDGAPLGGPNPGNGNFTGKAAYTIQRGFSVTTNLYDRKAYVGDSLTYWVRADCGGPLSFQWVWSDGVQDVLPVGGNTDTLTIAPITMDEVGYYWCYIAYDREQHSSQTASLSVGQHLRIVETPRGGNVAIGSTHTFAVLTSGGFEPLTYLWKHDGKPVGTNSTCTVSIQTLCDPDLGAYTVEVSDNNTDVVTSAPAQLTTDVGLPVGTAVGIVAIMLGCIVVAGAAISRRGRAV